ncbi:MAG: hypothetical protein ACLFSQ_11045 [Candidatus Zixiibacteriota bacterium]
MERFSLILLLIIAISAIDIHNGFVEVDDKNVPTTEQKTPGYVRYVNSIERDTTLNFSATSGIYCYCDHLGYSYLDSLVLIIEYDSIYYADTLFMLFEGWPVI